MRRSGRRPIVVLGGRMRVRGDERVARRGWIEWCAISRSISRSKIADEDECLHEGKGVVSGTLW
jgi:hypothetical protein